MQILRRIPVYCLIAVLALFAVRLPAQTNGPNSGTPKMDAERDGQHDFDFEFGKWKVHNWRLVHPLSGSKESIEYDGMLVARPIWGGKANMDEFEAEAPSGHVDGMTVRTYNPTSHEWSIYWTNSKLGAFGIPPTVGKFKNGRGEFFDMEPIGGRTVLVRFLWLVPTPDTPRWEQAFSVDGGKTWETNYIITYTRVAKYSLGD